MGIASEVTEGSVEEELHPQRLIGLLTVPLDIWVEICF